MKKFDPNRFHHAVMVIALMRARKAVKAQLRAKGEKPQLYSMKEITVMAEQWLQTHMEELINKAAADVATFPEFAKWLGANPDLASVCKAMTKRTLPSDGNGNYRTNQQ